MLNQEDRPLQLGQDPRLITKNQYLEDNFLNIAKNSHNVLNKIITNREIQQ